MTYTPSEAEKTVATLVQAASAIFYFVPALIIRRTGWGRSPYVRYWAKANMCWSIYLFIITICMFGVGEMFHTKALVVAVWFIHSVMVILAAFASMFNRPVGYSIIVEKHCLKEMGAVYGAVASAKQQAIMQAKERAKARQKDDAELLDV